MTADAENTGEGVEFHPGPLEGRTLWRIGAALLGASLWAQLFWYPLATEFLSGQEGLVYVGAYILPTLALVVAFIVDEPAGYLFFVPGSFIPGMVLLPQQDAVALLQLHRSLFIVGTLLSFVCAAALASVGGRNQPQDSESLEASARTIDGVYRYYTSLRIAILVVLFGVLVGAAIFDPSMTSAIAEHHGGGRIEAQVFIVVFGFFIWCALAYTMFFLPAANLEYDVRRLSREIDQLAEDATSIRWRLGLVAAGGAVLVALAFAWRFLL